MKKVTLFTLIGISILLIASCAKVYYSPDAVTLADSHKVIAILPPSVSIAAAKKTDPEAIKEQQKTESLNFQNEMYSWMLKRKMQGRMTQEIQDIESTNAKLKRAGYPDTLFTPVEMCEILGVDGVLASNYSLSKPMSDGAAVAMIILGGVGSTNEVSVTLNINDCLNKKLIWNYSHKYSGGIGSSPANLVDGLMRNASKKMPYMKP
ncbi:MAG TPA: hypothetical protein DIW47_11940 [Bacteroidetes bacterium]|nr:hypothetical protein [Bacteroidota bacterium]